MELKPYEQLFGDLSGVGTISRAEHRALRGRPAFDADALAEAVDAQLVEPADDGGPVRPAAPPGDEMRDADGSDDGVDEMPGATGGLMTLEEAAEALRL